MRFQTIASSPAVRPVPPLATRIAGGALSAAAACVLLATTAVPAFAANDYPTSERVLYVEACMTQHPGQRYEMLNKCSCTIDKIAADVSYDEYETMSTALNASTIGGERGSVIRDAAVLQDEVKKFKALQTKAKQACFINLDPK